MSELEAAALRWEIDPQALAIDSIAELPLAAEAIGQPRAVAAPQFALRTPDHGFNGYVTGPPGVGKMASVQALVAPVDRALCLALGARRAAAFILYRKEALPCPGPLYLLSPSRWS